MSYQLNEIKVKIKFVGKEGKLKATITLDFGDFVVRGFRIQESLYENPKGDKLWLTPPTYQAGGRYHPIFYMPDSEFWDELANKIWEEYYGQLGEWKKGEAKPEEKNLWV